MFDFKDEIREPKGSSTSYSWELWERDELVGVLEVTLTETKTCVIDELYIKPAYRGLWYEELAIAQMWDILKPEKTEWRKTYHG